DEIGRQRQQQIALLAAPAVVDLDVLSFDIAGIAKALTKCWQRVRLRIGSALGKKADNRHRRLLRARRERPCCRPAASPREEFAFVHSITLSARPRRGGGRVMPSALAVLRLMTTSTFPAG